MARSKVAASGKAGGGLLRTVERLGMTRGLSGGKKGWFYVGTGLWTLRTVRRMAERKTEVLVSETLQPGQRIVIANGRVTIDQSQAQAGVVTRASAKRAEKAAKRARSKRRKG